MRLLVLGPRAMRHALSKASGLSSRTATSTTARSKLQLLLRRTFHLIRLLMHNILIYAVKSVGSGLEIWVTNEPRKIGDGVANLSRDMGDSVGKEVRRDPIGATAHGPRDGRGACHGACSWRSIAGASPEHAPRQAPP